MIIFQALFAKKNIHTKDKTIQILKGFLFTHNHLFY